MEKPQAMVILQATEKPRGKETPPGWETLLDWGLLKGLVKHSGKAMSHFRSRLHHQYHLHHQTFCRCRIAQQPKTLLRQDECGRHRKHTLRGFSTRHQDHSRCRSRF